MPGTTGTQHGGEAPPEPPPQPGTDSFTAEGVLKEALVKLWEQARGKKVETIETLTIRMFEAGDGFRLLGSIGSVAGAEKKVTIEGDYETQEAGEFEFTFNGPINDAQLVREFLEPQMRDAKSTKVEVTFALTFAEGMSLLADAPEKLTERLTRFASGAGVKGGEKPDQRAEQNTATAAVGVRWSEGVGMRAGGDAQVRSSSPCYARGCG